jgi:hypothetical protein
MERFIYFEENKFCFLLGVVTKTNLLSFKRRNRAEPFLPAFQRQGKKIAQGWSTITCSLHWFTCEPREVRFKKNKKSFFLAKNVFFFAKKFWCLWLPPRPDFGWTKHEGLEL